MVCCSSEGDLGWVGPGEEARRNGKFGNFDCSLALIELIGIVCGLQCLIFARKLGQGAVEDEHAASGSGRGYE